MFVCVCRGVTDSQIREAVYNGASSLEDVRRELGVAGNCGRCAQCACEVIARSQDDIASMHNHCRVA